MDESGEDKQAIEQMDMVAGGKQRDFLENKIKLYIREFDEKRSYNRRATILLRVITILFGALTTIILGLKLGNKPHFSPDDISNAALVLSSFVTAVSAWEAFSDYQTKWITYRTALYLFYCIRDDFEFQSKRADFPTAQQANDFLRTYRGFSSRYGCEMAQLAPES